jgi:DNA-binding transcriptional MerR regulator
MQTAVAIPDKLFFKIGEVCDLVGVQAHVLRYWETEFPMLQPQKNRAGQRTYRRKDVEMALRIKELLYDEGFTIAGAKRKLAGENRGSHSKLKMVPPHANAGELGHSSQTGAPGSSEELPGETLSARPIPRDTIQRLRLMAEDLLTSLSRQV